MTETDAARLEEKLKEFQEELEREKDEHQIPEEPVSMSVDADVKVERRKRNLIFDEERFEETFLKCLICRENYNSHDKLPKMLPCHHTFCLDCLRQMWRVEGEFRVNLTSAFRGNMPLAVKIQCPTCRDGLITSEAEVCRLPNDHTIVELLTFVTATGKSDVQYCSKHQMQPLNFFCEPCIAPVCCDCTVLDHKESQGHVVVNVDEALEKYTPIVDKTMEDISAEREVLDQQRNNLLKAGENMNEIEFAIGKKIRDAFNRLRDTVDEREKELFQLSEFEINRKRQLLEGHLQKVTDRESALKTQFDALQQARSHKDISTMFSGHKASTDVLSQEVAIDTHCTDTFSVSFGFNETDEQKICDSVTNMGDIMFQE
ncbi:tripartite motif-containing protein 2-like isoform X2 [Gigantopelta aegis]|nr:tripartite motif-containing protein 2-like isoform X2 [Gigantopelta aegis]XP_041363960.1 tripartite motif-containing protein 2-like isoform X2 [Gigantopelta aegis]